MKTAYNVVYSYIFVLIYIVFYIFQRFVVFFRFHFHCALRRIRILHKTKEIVAKKKLLDAEKTNKIKIKIKTFKQFAIQTQYHWIFLPFISAEKNTFFSLHSLCIHLIFVFCFFAVNLRLQIVFNPNQCEKPLKELLFAIFFSLPFFHSCKSFNHFLFTQIRIFGYAITIPPTYMVHNFGIEFICCCCFFLRLLLFYTRV